MTDQEVSELVGNIAPSKVAHKTDPNDVLAGKASFVPYDGSAPQPGDAFQFDTANGTYQFVVADDGSWQLAGVPKAPAKAEPSSGYMTAAQAGADPTSVWGKTLDHYAQQLNDPNTTPAERAALIGSYNTALDNALKGTASAATLDANTQALAASARQKMGAGKMPTQAELEALNKVQTASGSSIGALANAAKTPVGSAVMAATDDPRVQQAMMLGALLEGGSLTGNWGAGDGGGSVGPYQINHNADPTTGQPMHSDISMADSQDPVKATQYMLSSYEQAVQQVPDALWQSNPMAAAAQAVYLAEKPANMYSSARVTNAWQQLTGGQGNPSDLTLPSVAPSIRNFGSATAPDWRQYNASTATWQPVTGLAGQPPETRNFGDATAPDWRQWNPSSKQWEAVTDANGVPIGQLPKAQIALQQYTETVNYIYDQLKAGTFGADPAKAQQQANQYLQSANQILTASLQGTTPYELQQAQIKNQQAQETVAKDLLDQQMSSGASLADSLINSTNNIMKGNTIGMGGFNPLTYARLMGWTTGEQTAQGLEQKLLQGLGGNASPNAAAGQPAVPSANGLAAMAGITPAPPGGPVAPQPLHPLAQALVGGLTGQATPDISQLLNEGAPDVAARIANGLGAGGLGPAPAVGSVQAQQGVPVPTGLAA